MNEPKVFASLSSGLLARKGGAKPAMRPQGFGQMGASLEDLGWNDMGFEPPKPTLSAQPRDADHDAFGDSVAQAPIRNPVAALTPSPVASLTPSPVHSQQAELAQQFSNQGEEEEDGEDEAVEQNPAPAAPLVLRVAPPASAGSQAVPAEVLPIPAPVARAERSAGPKAAFTLRLDAARHLRLRLACALTGRSAQMLVTEAVDKLLQDYPELEKFAGQLPQGSRSRRAKG